MNERPETGTEAWLKSMDDRARKCSMDDGRPDVIVGFYAAKKIRGAWRISNGRAWWNDPVVVREIHEYADGTVCATNYIEGVQMFSRRNIEDSGLKAIRPSEVTSFLPISKVVYFNHKETDERGKAQRLVINMTQKEAAAQ